MTSAGLAGGLGLIIFYIGLAAGPMSMVAPLPGLASTTLPVVVALKANGLRPGVYAGVPLRLAAIVLASSASDRGPAPRTSAAPRPRCGAACRRAAHGDDCWWRRPASLQGRRLRLAVTDKDQRLAWMIIFATIPVGLTGVALEHTFRTLFAKLAAAAVLLSINGLILLGTEALRRSAVRRKRAGAAPAGRPAQAVAPARALAATTAGPP